MRGEPGQEEGSWVSPARGREECGREDFTGGSDWTGNGPAGEHTPALNPREVHEVGSTLG